MAETITGEDRIRIVKELTANMMKCMETDPSGKSILTTAQRVIFIPPAAHQSRSSMNPSSLNPATEQDPHPPPEDDDIFAFIRHLIPSPSPEVSQALDRSRVISPSPERDAPVSSSRGGQDVVKSVIDITSPDASPRPAPGSQTHSPRWSEIPHLPSSRSRKARHTARQDLFTSVEQAAKDHDMQALREIKKNHM